MTSWWNSKTLEELNEDEWEALCDGCGKCCMVKFEDEESGELLATSLACQLFDDKRCNCTDYENRSKKVSDCKKITVENVSKLPWLPSSCAYVLRSKGKKLPEWHHLECGDHSQMHLQMKSVQGRTTSIAKVKEKDLEKYIIAPISTTPTK